jgi:ADP-ribose pyrophosphatase YjhB (NUDIX family)
VVGLRRPARLFSTDPPLAVFYRESHGAALALAHRRLYLCLMNTSKTFHRLVPDGDTHERDVCTTCGFVNYQNPRIVVGSVVRHEGKVLLCRRAIEPRRGFWTVPAGYLELNESPEDGARREAREEALAQLKLGELLAVYSVPHLSQVQLIWRAELIDSEAGGALFGVGEESLEVKLFDWDKIPTDEIAFPTVHWMLGNEREVMAKGYSGPFANPG